MRARLYARPVASGGVWRVRVVRPVAVARCASCAPVCVVAVRCGASCHVGRVVACGARVARVVARVRACVSSRRRRASRVRRRVSSCEALREPCRDDENDARNVARVSRVVVVGERRRRARPIGTESVNDKRVVRVRVCVCVCHVCVCLSCVVSCVVCASCVIETNNARTVSRVVRTVRACRARVVCVCLVVARERRPHRATHGARVVVCVVHERAFILARKCGESVAQARGGACRVCRRVWNA